MSVVVMNVNVNGLTFFGSRIGELLASLGQLPGGPDT